MPEEYLWQEGSELDLWRVSFHAENGQTWTNAWVASPG